MSDIFRLDQTRRGFLKSAAFAGVGGTALTAFGAPAHAQDAKFPSETINVVTHAGPGGGTDITTRMMMLQGRAVFKQDMVVVSKRGGSGSASLMYLNSRPRDGHTILTLTQSHIFQIIQKKVPLKIEDIVGLARATDDPQVIAVPANSKIKSLQDVIAASKDKQGGLKWGTTFAGGADHVGIHNLCKAAGKIPYTIVPFKGGGDIVTNLVAGNVDVALLNVAEGESQFAAGELRVVSAVSEERISTLKDVKTAKEEGVNAIASTVRGFVCLSGTPEDRVKILSDGLVKAMKDPIYQNYLASGGIPKSSVVGTEQWTAHIRRIHDESTTALSELGML